jgi:hypothetical protein
VPAKIGTGEMCAAAKLRMKGWQNWRLEAVWPMAAESFENGVTDAFLC